MDRVSQSSLWRDDSDVNLRLRAPKYRTSSKRLKLMVPGSYFWVSIYRRQFLFDMSKEVVFA